MVVDLHQGFVQCPYGWLEGLRINEETHVHLTRALLLKNQWNADHAVREFSEDPDYFRDKFGFEIGENLPPSGSPSEEILCEVCFCDVPLAEFVFIEDCGHGLCTECYAGYLESKVGDGPECVLTVCPNHTCNMIVPERLFKQLLPEERYQRYRSFLLKSFVDLSTQAKWCPGRDCQMAVEYKHSMQVDLTCDSCSKAFCFFCTRDAHLPIDCESLATWLDRMSKGEDDSANWMKINTKPCPKCKRPIEKNQGCNHMTCRCGYEFCYVCGGKYRGCACTGRR